MSLLPFLCFFTGLYCLWNTHVFRAHVLIPLFSASRTELAVGVALVTMTAVVTWKVRHAVLCKQERRQQDELAGRNSARVLEQRRNQQQQLLAQGWTYRFYSAPCMLCQVAIGRWLLGPLLSSTSHLSGILQCVQPKKDRIDLPSNPGWRQQGLKLPSKWIQRPSRHEKSRHGRSYKSGRVSGGKMWNSTVKQSCLQHVKRT